MTDAKRIARQEFEMTQEQLDRILEACKPVPYLVFGGIPPESPQVRANRAWRALGDELGFDWDTVQPIDGKSQRHFTAEALEPAATPEPDND